LAETYRDMRRDRRAIRTSGPRWDAELSALLESIPCAAVIEREENITEWNHAAQTMRGGEVAGQIPVEQVFLGGYPYRDGKRKVGDELFECALLRADGRMVPVHGALREFQTESGLSRLVTIMGYTRGENAAAGQGTFLGDLLDEAPEAVAITVGGRILYVNREFMKLFGLSSSDCLGVNLDERITPLAIRGEAQALEQAVERDGRASMETRRLHRDGDELDVSLLAGPIRVRGDEYGLFYTFRDIRSQKRVEAKLQHQAMHDSLTGLANRALLTDRVQEALKRLRRDGERKFAVIFLDLDGFKAINDEMGHDVGDEVLLTVSRVLRDCLRPQDTLARFGGDEFAMLLEDMPSAELATIVAERLHRSLRAAALPDGAQVSASVGIAMVTSRGGIASRVLREADIAMYHAKAAGKARTVVFERGMTMGRTGAGGRDRSSA
jgi:diguanylate cyclase (GGDEF)-like protein/PAS domain S-box-containing protein